MIIDKEILKIVKSKGQYRFSDEEGNIYVVLMITEDGIIKTEAN